MASSRGGSGSVDQSASRMLVDIYQIFWCKSEERKVVGGTRVRSGKG